MGGSRRAVGLGLLAVAWIASSAVPAAGQYYDTFGKNKVRYAKFDWRVYHAPHFDVHYYPEEEHLLERVRRPPCAVAARHGGTTPSVELPVRARGSSAEP